MTAIQQKSGKTDQSGGGNPERVPVWSPWGVQTARKLSPFARRLAAIERLKKIKSSKELPRAKVAC